MIPDFILRKSRPNPTQAVQELCVLESPLGSNKGKKIEQYLKCVLIPPDFIITNGGGKGHTSIVAIVFDICILTIEGNTNQNHSHEGIGVFQLTRKIDEINMGFINYG